MSQHTPEKLLQAETDPLFIYCLNPQGIKMTFKDWLISKSACAEGFKAHSHQTEHDFWDSCERADWMLWVAERKYGEAGWPDHRAFVKIACLCAKEALIHVPAGEDRPRLAIEAAVRWVDDPSAENQDAARGARDAAGDARDAAGAAGDAAGAAGDAAGAAGDAAGAAGDAGDAARGARDAARGARDAARDARDAENKKQADFIREIWPRVGV